MEVLERLGKLVVYALLDLGTIVIAALNGPRPRSYSEVGAMLRSLRVLGDGEAGLVRSLADLRNALIYSYAVADRGSWASEYAGGCYSTDLYIYSTEKSRKHL